MASCKVKLSCSYKKISSYREVVVAQLVEWSLSIPEVCSLTPVISKIYIEHVFVY